MLEALIPSGATIFLVALIIVLMVFIRTGVKQVPPKQEWTVERFGKYSRTMQLGLNLMIPFVETVACQRSLVEGGRNDAPMGQ
ncbi:MAG: hypothetical protein HKN28_00215 [Alphaproteobacteria bacterium]|nr:hypothetical protein [Alphaproteobacteria bacterium]